ncbi:MAG: hypothetical protein N4A33_07500 [Bacteriovoracaceae bacterium]|nr:hypothetical protein [Bacteriovoracaceae bacterium]
MKYSFVADHWAYPMIIFLSILIAFLLIRIPSKLISWSFIISFFIFFLLSNIKQQHIFKNEFSIIEHNIIHNKTSSFLYYYLAKKNYDIGDYQSAIDLLEKAQKINSNDPKIIFLKKKIISTLKQ